MAHEAYLLNRWGDIPRVLERTHLFVSSLFRKGGKRPCQGGSNTWLAGIFGLTDLKDSIFKDKQWTIVYQEAKGEEFRRQILSALAHDGYSPFRKRESESEFALNVYDSWSWPRYSKLNT